MSHLINIASPSKFNVHDQVTHEIITLAKSYFNQVSVLKKDVDGIVQYFCSSKFLRSENTTINWGAYIGLSYQVFRRLPQQVSQIVADRSYFILEDYAFADWAYTEICHIPESVKYITFDDNLKPFNLIKPMGNATFKNMHLKKPNLIESNLTREKYFDVLIAMDYRLSTIDVGSLEQYLKDTYSCEIILSQDNYQDIYQQSLISYDKSPFDVFMLKLSESGLSLEELRDQDKPSFDAMMRGCHVIDMNVRRKRRLVFLDDFIKSYPKLKTVICDPYGYLGSLANNTNITLLDSMQYRSYQSLLSRSRFALFSNPTYPSAINQRIVEGLSQGCLSICDYAPAIDNVYNHPDHAVTDLENLETILGQTHEYPLKIVNTYLKLKPIQSLAEALIDAVLS